MTGIVIRVNEEAAFERLVRLARGDTGQAQQSPTLSLLGGMQRSASAPTSLVFGDWTL